MNIRDLAKEAGVSVATISRVINHPEAVLPETRERVLEFITRYNYDPKPATKGGGRGRRSVTIIVPSLGHCGEMISGAQSIFREKGLLVNLCDASQTEGGTARLISVAAGGKCCGVLLAGDGASDFAELHQSEIPVVLIGKPAAADSENACYINYNDSAAKMTAYLLDMGYENIGFISTAEDYPEKVAIKSGFLEALPAESKSDFPCWEAEDSARGGYLFLRERVASGKKLPRALFAATDEIAIGILKAAADEGITVPGQLAVVGFGSNPLGAMVTPELTSMEHPLFRLGAVAARRLIDLIEDSALYEVETHEIVLKSRLKIRRSCGNRREIYELFE